MTTTDLKEVYRTIQEDVFPDRMEISFVQGGKRQTVVYEKARWNICGETQGLRYGENPDQPATLYRPVNGNLVIGDVTCIAPGAWLCSDMELLQSGKHPGKINVTDVDSALNIMKYFGDAPCCVIAKHNNPSGAAVGDAIVEAFEKAYFADRLAAYGGAVALNRSVSRELAEAISGQYFEVVAAPEYEPGVLDVFAKKKNLRILRIAAMERLGRFATERFVDYKSLMDGGIIAQLSFASAIRTRKDFLPARCTYKEREYVVERAPTEREYEDMVFGWLVETGISSNSVIYVKDGATVGIGTGEQDRVGVAEIARDKAYRKLSDRLSWDLYGKPWNLLADEDARNAISTRVAEVHGGLSGSVMISDAFFPFRDGIDVGLKEGVRAVVQPGGSLRDFECIEACNECGATMVFTGQRCFRH